MRENKQAKVINGFCDAVGDLLASDIVQQMRQYPHHGKVSTFWHSVYVSYLTYRFCGGLHLQQREAARAALLHDFYLYNWYTQKHSENHIWYHPKEAVKNAEAYFEPLTAKQKNMILSHMWPLFVETPKSKEAYVLTVADKIAATRDLVGLSGTFTNRYAKIEKELKRRGAFENCM